MLKYHNKVRVLDGHGGETWELAPAKSASASPSRSSAPSGLQPEVPTVEKKKGKAEGSGRKKSESENKDDPFSMDALALKYHNKVRVPDGHGGHTWETAPATSASASASSSSAPIRPQAEVDKVEKKKKEKEKEQVKKVNN